MSTTIVEKESSSPAAAFLIFILFAVLVVGAVWLAYSNGIVGKPAVIEKNKTVIVPTPSTPAPPAK